MSSCWYVQLSTVSNYVISFFFFSCLFGVLKSTVFCVLSVSELKRMVTISKLGWCWPPYRKPLAVWKGWHYLEGGGGGWSKMGNKHSQDNNVNNIVTSNLSNLRVHNKYRPPLIWKNGIYSALRTTSLNLLKTFGFGSFYFLLVCISLLFHRKLTTLMIMWTILSGDVHVLSPETEDYEQQLFIIVDNWWGSSGSKFIQSFCSVQGILCGQPRVSKKANMSTSFLKSMYLAFLKKR